jgi:uncharacterized Fe-S radical SAM superfamily protein PflX
MICLTTLESAFCGACGFMGFEYQGYTSHNINKLWSDPVVYAEQVMEVMTYLADYELNVSMYNSHLYTTPEVLWKYA